MTRPLTLLRVSVMAILISAALLYALMYLS